MYAFYIKEDFFLMRREYNQYCQWVVEQLDSLRFGIFVQHVDYLDERRCYRVRGVHERSGEGFEFLTRRLVLGTGTTPHLPSCCEGLADHVSHSATTCRTSHACRASARSRWSAAARARRRSTTTCCRKSTATTIS